MELQKISSIQSNFKHKEQSQQHCEACFSKFVEIKLHGGITKDM